MNKTFLFQTWSAFHSLKYGYQNAPNKNSLKMLEKKVRAEQTEMLHTLPPIQNRVLCHRCSSRRNAEQVRSFWKKKCYDFEGGFLPLIHSLIKTFKHTIKATKNEKKNLLLWPMREEKTHHILKHLKIPNLPKLPTGFPVFPLPPTNLQLPSPHSTPRGRLTGVLDVLDLGVPCEEANPLSTSLAMNSERSDSDWKEPGEKTTASSHST